jgi:hypothetical protein
MGRTTKGDATVYQAVSPLPGLRATVKDWYAKQQGSAGKLGTNLDFGNIEDFA